MSELFTAWFRIMSELVDVRVVHVPIQIVVIIAGLTNRNNTALKCIKAMNVCFNAVQICSQTVERQTQIKCRVHNHYAVILRLHDVPGGHGGHVSDNRDPNGINVRQRRATG